MVVEQTIAIAIASPRAHRFWEMRKVGEGSGRQSGRSRGGGEGEEGREG